ncbi:PAS domain-containing protein [Massilia sp. TN1-12]|uniref:PAS domain-containing protein n=1 Tax=Massilia paldalensis TaxID=3377675 RepID=UPI00384E7946
MTSTSTEILLMLMPVALLAAILLARQQQRLAALTGEVGELRRTVLHLESLFEQAPLGMAVFDTEGRFLRVNGLLADINGLTPGDHLGKTLRDLVPGVADASEAAFHQVMQSRQPVVGMVFDGATEANPGHKRTWRLSVHPVFDRAQKLLGVSAAVEDITEQHRLTAALRESEQRERRRAAELESVMEAAPVAIFIAHDRDCRHVTANATCRRLLRLAPGESPTMTGPGIRSYDVYEGEQAVAPEHLPLERAAASGEETWGRELVTRFADGDRLHIMVNAVPLRDERGRVRGAVAAFIDRGAAH